MRLTDNLDIASTVPKNRLVLTVAEVADRLLVTNRHIVSLIEGGEMVAVDVSGRRDCFPMPVEAVNQLAARLKVTPQQLVEFIRSFRRANSQRGRASWRVPVAEGFLTFMRQRNSLNGARI